jgi:hypothetical protein
MIRGINMDMDIAWEYYCNTERPEDIFKETNPEDYSDGFDMFDYYEIRGYENFTKAIEDDFEDWYNESE